jgi:hypothetical protein
MYLLIPDDVSTRNYLTTRRKNPEDLVFKKSRDTDIESLF